MARRVLGPRLLTAFVVMMLLMFAAVPADAQKKGGVLRIGNLGATKEPDIDVSFEGIDIGECRISYTRGRMAVMQ